MAILTSSVSTRSDEFAENAAAMEAQLATIRAAAELALEGGPERTRKRHLERGKMLPRDRVQNLLDPGSPFLEVGLLAAHDLYHGDVPAAGVIAGIVGFLIPFVPHLRRRRTSRRSRTRWQPS